MNGSAVSSNLTRAVRGARRKLERKATHEGHVLGFGFRLDDGRDQEQDDEEEDGVSCVGRVREEEARAVLVEESEVD